MKKLIRILRVALNAINMALYLEAVLKKQGDLPPSVYNSGLKVFNTGMNAVYGDYTTEDFTMLIAWSPLYR